MTAYRVWIQKVSREEDATQTPEAAVGEILDAETAYAINRLREAFEEVHQK